jgi:UDP-glucose:(heptosyl)LPS alpha-1,3-glucosyltransferase
MQAITVQMVCEAAEKLLGHNHQQPASNLRQSFAEASKSFFVHPVYKARLGKLGLNSIDAVFSFNAGRELAKENLAAFRSRLEFEIDSPYSGRPTTLFLKRYERPPLSVQFKNWLAARKKTSCARLEFDAANALSQRHLNTPKTVACGEQWGMFLEKRSFTIAEKIPNADSLERNLPDYFNPPDTTEKLKLRRDFINQLAAFVKRFHETDYRHRDLYFSHIFYDAAGEFYLIDLARTFRRAIPQKRYCSAVLLCSGKIFFKCRPTSFLPGLRRLRHTDKRAQSIYPQSNRQSKVDGTTRSKAWNTRSLFTLSGLGYNLTLNMKVAIIIERADIALGGAERSVFELADALQARGLEVDILAAKGRTHAGNIHLLCQNMPRKRVSYFTFAQALKKYLAERHYDIVHSVLPFPFADIYQPRGGSFAESIIRNAASYQTKLMAHYKKMTAFANLRRTVLLCAEKKLSKSPDGPILVALSKYVADQFRRHYRLDQNRIVVMPNGIRTDKKIDKAKAEKLRKQILSQLAVSEAQNPTFFLFVANNFRLKGLSVLIEAMHLAADHSVNGSCYLIVAGNGPANRYRRYAEELGVRDRIIFLGPVPQIQNVLSITDVAVLPTFYDPSSRFILEAIAANKPVITTRFNGAADLFVNNRHGIVIDSPEDAPALAKAVRHFTDTNNVQQASKAIIQDELREKLSIARVTEKLNSLYEQIVENRRQQ